MHPLLTDAYNALLHALLPIRCVVCKKESPQALCDACWKSFIEVSEQICAVCRKPSLAGITHATCSHAQNLDQLICLYDYKSIGVAELIIAGKYKFIPDAFHVIAPQLGRFIKNYIDIPTDAVVTPLPLHRFRERWRGFNQAAILAQHISAELGTPYADVLIRHRSTKTQKDLKRAERLVNIHNSFSIAPHADVTHTTVLLVDDVTTSGSTLQEAAKILKQHGAPQVVGITLARD